MHIFWLVLEVGVGWMGVGGGVWVWDGSGEGLGWGLGGWLGVWGRDLGVWGWKWGPFLSSLCNPYVVPISFSTIPICGATNVASSFRNPKRSNPWRLGKIAAAGLLLAQESHITKKWPTAIDK